MARHNRDESHHSVYFMHNCNKSSSKVQETACENICHRVRQRRNSRRRHETLAVGVVDPPQAPEPRRRSQFGTSPLDPPRVLHNNCSKPWDPPSSRSPTYPLDRPSNPPRWRALVGNCRDDKLHEREGKSPLRLEGPIQCSTSLSRDLPFPFVSVLFSANPMTSDVSKPSERLPNLSIL
jgi:hypothetical protein